MKRLWVLALATCLVIGCAPPSVYRKIERTAVNAIQTELGPAESWSAKVSRDKITDLVEGDISQLSVKGKRVRPRPDLIIDEVVLEARDLNVDVKNKTLNSVKETAISAKLSPSSLALMIESMTDIREPSVTFEPDLVEVRGVYDVMGVPFRIRARGRMTVEPPRILRFTSDSVTAVGLTAPLKISKTLDMGKVYPAILLESVTISPTAVTAHGSLEPAALAKLIEDRKAAGQ
ncbi:MAG: hypothetical protein GYA63_03735 [Armatimonadetes bacterium]|jgi:hypothetical protein|nr:hypothetical protein [Armatimonadota bacterium]